MMDALISSASFLVLTEALAVYDPVHIENSLSTTCSLSDLRDKLTVCQV